MGGTVRPINDVIHKYKVQRQVINVYVAVPIAITNSVGPPDPLTDRICPTGTSILFEPNCTFSGTCLN